MAAARTPKRGIIHRALRVIILAPAFLVFCWFLLSITPFLFLLKGSIAIMTPLEASLQSMIAIFEGKESEENWKKRELSCIELSKLSKTSAPKDHPTVFASGIRLLIDGILRCATSERTTLSKHACELVQNLSAALGSSIHPMLDIILPSCIQLCGYTKPTASKNGDATVTAIINHAGFNLRLLHHIASASEDKKTPPRQYAAGWLKIMITKYTRQNEQANGLDLIDRSIRLGLNDAQPKVREAMRATYWAFAQMYSDRADSILAELNSHAQKALQDDANNPNKAEKVLKKTSKSSIKDAIAVQRKNKAATQESFTQAPADDVVAAVPSIKEMIRAQRKAAMQAQLSNQDTQKDEILLPPNPKNTHREVSTSQKKHHAPPQAAERQDVSVHRRNPSKSSATSDQPEQQSRVRSSKTAPPPEQAQADLEQPRSLLSAPVRRPRLVLKPTAIPPNSSRPTSRAESTHTDQPVTTTTGQMRAPSRPDFASARKLLADTATSLSRHAVSSDKADADKPTTAVSDNATADRTVNGKSSTKMSKGSVRPASRAEAANSEQFTSSTTSSATTGSTSNISAKARAVHGYSRSDSRADYTAGENFKSSTSAASSVVTHGVAAKHTVAPQPATRPKSAIYVDGSATSSTSSGHSNDTIIRRRPTTAPSNNVFQKPSFDGQNITEPAFQPPTAVTASTRQVTDSMSAAVPTEDPVLRTTSPLQGEGKENDMHQIVGDIRRWHKLETAEKPRSISPRSQDPEMARKMISTGIEKIKNRTIDDHGYRKLQGLIHFHDQIFEDEQKYDDMLLALLDALETPNTEKRAPLGRRFDNKFQILVTIRLMFIHNRKYFSAYHPRAMSAIINARGNFESRCHIVGGLEETAEDIVAICSPPDVIDAVLDVLETEDLNEHGVRTTIMGLHSLSGLVGRIRANKTPLEPRQEKRLATFGLNCLRGRNTKIRRAVVEYCLELRRIIKPEDRFYRLLTNNLQDLKNLLTYYIANEEM